jgi:hypothetical protein
MRPTANLLAMLHFMLSPVARVLLLLLTLTAATGCTRSDTPAESQVRYEYSWSAEVLGTDPQIQAEQQYRPLLGNLVADPERGVWGSQDGELFRFSVDSNGGQSRVTYKRPHPAVISMDDLVLLSPTQLAGRLVTAHVVRQAADGQVHEIAPARAPDGAPFDALDQRDGKLRFRSSRSVWYTYDAATRQFEYAEQFKPGYLSYVADEQKRKLEQLTNGYSSAVVASGDGNLWGVVIREQLFRFDLTNHQFTLLGSSVSAGTGSRPVGGLNGQLVVQSTDALVLLDATGRIVREYPTAEPLRRALPGPDGWFYLLPQMAVNVATGEVRQYSVDVQNGTDGLRAVYGGSATALTPLGDGRLAGGTGHFGSLFAFDPASGDIDSWGRPLPELGQQSGEELAPIQGLTRGANGYLYAAIGSGAQGTEESHVVRVDATGQVASWTHVSESIHDLVLGADGIVYGATLDRVVVIRQP